MQSVRAELDSLQGEEENLLRLKSQRKDAIISSLLEKIDEFEREQAFCTESLLSSERLAVELEETKAVNRELRLRIEYLEDCETKIIQRLYDKIETSVSMNRKLKETINCCEETIDEYGELEMSFMEAIDRLQRNFEDESERRKVEMKNAISQFEKEISLHKIAIAESESTTLDLQSDLSQAICDNTQLKYDIDMKEQEIVQLRNMLDESQSTLASSQEQMRYIQEADRLELLNIKSRLEDMLMNKNEIEKQLESVCSALDTITEELSFIPIAEKKHSGSPKFKMLEQAASAAVCNSRLLRLLESTPRSSKLHSALKTILALLEQNCRTLQENSELTKVLHKLNSSNPLIFITTPQ